MYKKYDESKTEQQRMFTKMMSVTLCVCVSLFLVLELVSCAGGYHVLLQPEHSATYTGWGFSLTYPNTMEVRHTACIDFLLYAISENVDTERRDLVLIYAGNYPDFGEMPGRPRFPWTRSFELHGLPAKSLRWKTKEDQYFRELLVTLPYPFSLEKSLPQYVHLWYVGLSEEEKDLADAIMMSVRPLPDE